MIELREIKEYLVVTRYNYAIDNPDKFKKYKGIDIVENVALSLGMGRSTVYWYLKKYRKRMYLNRIKINSTFEGKLDQLITEFKTNKGELK